jgi:GTP pyrophosphokinase
MNSEQKNEKSDCWRAFSVVTGLYQSNPERMRDWISVPKSTGYESLHSTVVVPGGQWVEVQIRTKRMDEIAEKGLAAHWKYKGQKADNGLDGWVNKIRELLETSSPDNQSLIEDVKLNLYSQEIFVFTPKGDLKTLPKGATVLDFAYEVHSGVGNTCVGAKVNGKNVPIRYELNNGDKVEVMTSKNQKPKPDWIDFVVTSKAKAKIKLTLKEEKLREAENGKEILQRRLRNWKIGFNDLMVSKLLKHYKLKNAVDFYYLIATKTIELSDIKSFITTEEKPEVNTPERIGDYVTEKINPNFSEKSEDTLVIDETSIDLDYKLSKCCNPIFGDEIFGFVTINEGIKIHRLNCPNASQMISRYGYRIVKARWAAADSKLNYQTAIKVTGVDEVGIISKISDVIAKDLKVNLRSINIETHEGLFDGMIKLFVKDTSHLDVFIHKLVKIKGVLSAHRVDGV